MSKQIDPLASTTTGRGPWLQRLTVDIPFAVAAMLFAGCLAVELLHVEISEEVRKQIYSTFGTIVFVSCILLNTAHGRNYGLGWGKSFVFCILSFQVLFSWTSVIWADLDVMVFGHGAVASSRSIMLLPLLCFLLSRFCKIDTLNLCDYLTPYFFFDHGVVTLACWIQGCCAGKAWPWGLQSPQSGIMLFPAQPCIVVLSIAVAYWGLRHSQKNDYKANGIVFANSLIAYGFFRYLIELFTDDERVWWVVSWLSVCALFMIIQGFVFRYLSKKRYKTP